jgi:uncharacterized protein (DUF983 family)
MSRILRCVLRGARLRCPCCGHGSLFQSGFTMHDRCAACDEPFEREPGQWLGAIYVNVGLSEGVAITGFLLTQTLTSLTMPQQLAIWLPVSALAPIAFFRFAKGLWTSIVFLGEGLYLDWPTR